MRPWTWRVSPPSQIPRLRPGEVKVLTSGAAHTEALRRPGRPARGMSVAAARPVRPRIAERTARAELAPWAVALLLAAVIAIVYANGLRIGFHFDDGHVIEKNPHIQSLTAIPRFFVDPATSSSSHQNRVVRPL